MRALVLVQVRGPAQPALLDLDHRGGVGRAAGLNIARPCRRRHVQRVADLGEVVSAVDGLADLDGRQARDSAASAIRRDPDHACGVAEGRGRVVLGVLEVAGLRHLRAGDPGLGDPQRTIPLDQHSVRAVESSGDDRRVIRARSSGDAAAGDDEQRNAGHADDTR